MLTSRTDVPLSARGRAEARQAAAAIAAARWEIARLISSPARRAVETAEILSAALRCLVPIEIDVSLREIDFGPFEGRTPGELRAGDLAAAFDEWRDESTGRSPDGAESYVLASERATSVFEMLGQEEKRTLVIGHGYFLRLLIARCVLGVQGASLRRLRLDTGRFALVEWEGTLPRLVAMNTPNLTGLVS